MWGALARQIAAYALTRRGKKLLAFIGTMLLCFVTAILLDLQMYISAGLSGVLAAAALATWITQGFRQRRERERRQVETAARREAAAVARGEKIDYAKATVSGAVKNVTSGAAYIAGGTVRVAWKGLTGARDKVFVWRKKAPTQPPRSEPEA
jgi:type II secretory pathway pseudopilin PulG